MSESRSFDIGTPVIIQNLVKGAQYNGKCGFVVSPYNSASGRQNVFIKDANKTIAIKPINMKIDTKTRDLHEKLGADRKDKNKVGLYAMSCLFILLSVVPYCYHNDIYI